MEPKHKNLNVRSSLIEELSDEAMAACVGGCDITLGLVGTETSVPIEPIPLLGDTSVNLGLLRVAYDPNGSMRGRSDRNVKERFSPIDNQEVLDKVASLPITTWNYRDESSEVRHIGPMAQDFAATFGVGDDNRFINFIDANGVALAAIQALYQLVQQKNDQIDELRADLDALKQHLSPNNSTLNSVA